MKLLTGLAGIILTTTATAGELNIPEHNTPPFAEYKGVLHDEVVISRSGNPASYWFSMERDKELILFHSYDIEMAALMAPGDSISVTVPQSLYGQPINIRNSSIHVDVIDLKSVNGKEPVTFGRRY